MFFTYVVRPGDAPEGRGPTQPLFFETFLVNNLKLGFGTMLIGFVGIVICSLFNGSGLHVIKFVSPFCEAKQSTGIALFFMILMIIGVLCLNMSTILMDDDGSICQTRGFRSGCKALGQGALITLLGLVLIAVTLYSNVGYYEGNALSGLDLNYVIKCMFNAGLAITSVGFTLLGFAAFLVEVYSSDGTREILGFASIILCKISGMFMFLTVIFPDCKIIGFLFTIFTIIALTHITMWAGLFENVALKSRIKMTQSAVRNEYYKSRNALAYFGPPVMAEGNFVQQPTM
ncbi:multi-pass transmembrane protein [Cryptosporidium ryanae]|uniref:multi-pass transmembrane protein n=1 Tax=Cryptosporidium ryanae TaxID=515981 RepID=UPI003519DEEE|nr:multi-pass transmembrane protein [Cryptosporidium ryanae]